jgi:hypothetical protein
MQKNAGIERAAFALAIQIAESALGGTDDPMAGRIAYD